MEWHRPPGGRGRGGPAPTHAGYAGGRRIRGRARRVLVGMRRARGPSGVPRLGDYFVHCAQGMFQPLRPLSGAIFLSSEFLTITTSPMIDWS